MEDRAAQYLRMSTDHQKYSLENQAAAIADYAKLRGIEVVATYVDAGRSGVTIRGRVGLKQLLADVVGGATTFRQILVYDVSRWGRFQDPDQAAHYEFLCREAGYAVRYCAEPFEDDGTPTAAIMKHIKRVMAGEFSRELSSKSRAAQVRAAARGHKQGGIAPFGVRRVLLDSTGLPARVLHPGQHKALRDDKVIWAPGPAKEQTTVRRIFRWYGVDWVRPVDITRRLNAEGFPKPPGGDWTVVRVMRLLRNEIYRGVYVFNRTRQPFSALTVPNPPEQWVRSQVFPPIVSRKLFEAAAARIKSNRRIQLSDDELLRRLRRLGARLKHRVRGRDVHAAKGMPDVNTYRRRFGSFAHALTLAGLQAAPRRFNRRDDAGSRTSEAYLIAGLKRLLAQHGYLSIPLIMADPDLPSSSVFHERFGRIINAYRLAGWDKEQSEIVRLAKARGAARRWPLQSPDRSDLPA